MTARTDLLEQLNAEILVGFPVPWYPQDDPRVRTQRLPERCRQGHPLDEWTVLWKPSDVAVRWACRRCHNARNRGVLTADLRSAA